MNGNLNNNPSSSYHRPDSIVNRNWRVHDTAVGQQGTHLNTYNIVSKNDTTFKDSLIKCLDPNM